MKYIITERQSKILVEGFPIKLRRRFTYDYIKFNIDEVVKSVNHSMCRMTIDEYVLQVCNMTTGDIFYSDDVKSMGKEIHQYANEFRSYVKSLFGEYLRERYIKRCR